MATGPGSARSFGKADHGIAWAAAQLPGPAVRERRYFTGGTEVRTGPLPRIKGQAGPRGPDDYALRFERDAVAVQSNTAAGTILGLLKLGERLRNGKRGDFLQHLRFRTRNYKHELRLSVAGPRAVVGYTDATWESLFRGIVANGFNGVVFYPDHHPFEHILDYKGFPEAASRDEAERRAVREALCRGLEMAHRYGLATFMQHYVNHFTQALAEAHKIPMTGRLSAVDHPIVEEYCRYCYREIFRQLPDLDGLYFNFESTPSAWRHVLKTAIPECNRMARKPILFFRLWGFTEPEGMRRMLRAYKGRCILGHKISDTSDVYYLPVADSRVKEWKKLLGKSVEWTFLVGPCHNCGTNLCNQLWSDYDFVQAILDDARKKGADSISFHTYNELFAADVKDGAVFSEHEQAMSRFNYLHLQAAGDYVMGRTMPRGERARLLAGRSGVPARAGAALLKAIEASSRIVLLIYRQFCYTSALDGYLNRGRYSHIQEPFYYYPATELNDQARRLVWRGLRHAAWIPKTLPAKVAPEGEYQHILDYVDPSKRKARMNPGAIAAAIRRSIGESFAALGEYRRRAGGPAAEALEPYLRDNAVLGEYVRREILAAVRLYSIYFAKSRAAVLSAVREGLAELKALPPLVADTTSRTYKSMVRVAMFDRLDPAPEIEAAAELLRCVEEAELPMAAFREYLESRRLYNEIRRVVRPGRWHDAPVVACAARLLQASLAKAEGSLAKLTGPEHDRHAEGVQAWRDFVRNELQRTEPPRAACPRAPTGPFLALQHEHGFRAGEGFVEDFLGFFRPADYLRPSDFTFRVWHTPKELCVTFRERGIGAEQRKAQWERYREEGSCSYVMQVHVDAENKGRAGDRYIVWPMGESVSRNNQPHVKAGTEFRCDATSWETTVRLPFSLLGHTPRKGEVWGFNVYGNPAVARNRCYTWAAQYDSFNPLRFGKIRFE
jgi:hypothetical protein